MFPPDPNRPQPELLPKNHVRLFFFFFFLSFFAGESAVHTSKSSSGTPICISSIDFFSAGRVSPPRPLSPDRSAPTFLSVNQMPSTDGSHAPSLPPLALGEVAPSPPAASPLTVPPCPESSFSLSPPATRCPASSVRVTSTLKSSAFGSAKDFAYICDTVVVRVADLVRAASFAARSSSAPVESALELPPISPLSPPLVEGACCLGSAALNDALESDPLTVEGPAFKSPARAASDVNLGTGIATAAPGLNLWHLISIVLPDAAPYPRGMSTMMVSRMGSKSYGITVSSGMPSRSVSRSIALPSRGSACAITSSRSNCCVDWCL